MENHEFVQREGLDAWLEREEEKARAGVDLCAHLLKG